MNDDKNLPVVRPNNSPAELHNNGLKAGSLIDQALSRLNNEQAQNLLNKASEKALELEVKSLEQNMNYSSAEKAVGLHIEMFTELDKKGPLIRHAIETKVKTGAGNMQIESKSGAMCFVATVAYGDPNHSDVIFLRTYRDDVLQNYQVGRVFIGWYCKYGPMLAAIVGQSLLLQNMSKCVIARIVYGIRVVYTFRVK
jgi:hypothetical protein